MILLIIHYIAKCLPHKHKHIPIKIHFDLNVENYFYMQHFGNIIHRCGVKLFSCQSRIIRNKNGNRQSVLFLYHITGWEKKNRAFQFFQLAFLTRGFILIRFFFVCNLGHENNSKSLLPIKSDIIFILDLCHFALSLAYFFFDALTLPKEILENLKTYEIILFAIPFLLWEFLSADLKCVHHYWHNYIRASLIAK